MTREVVWWQKKSSNFYQINRLENRPRGHTYLGQLTQLGLSKVLVGAGKIQR